MILSPFETEALWLSLKVALAALAWSLPLALAAGWLLARHNFWGKSLVDALLHLPLVLPPVVTGYLLLLALGQRGPLGRWLKEWWGVSFSFSWRGAVLAALVVSFPLLLGAVRQAVEGLDRGLEEAAYTLGASRWRCFFSISLPLILPGLLQGSILAFARCLGEFGATISFVSNIPGETSTLPLALFTLLQQPGGEEGAFRLCLLSSALALLALAASRLLSARLQLRYRS